MTTFWQGIRESIDSWVGSWLSPWLNQGDISRLVLRRSRTRRYASTATEPTHDFVRADYAFWQRVYFGHAVGLELSGLLLKPLISKVAAWSLGRPPQLKCGDERSQEALDTWWIDHHPDILRAYRGSLKCADGFLVINPDLSLTLLKPDTVDPIVADDDYGQIIGWRITQIFAHPEENSRMLVIDEYYADRRTQRVEIDTIPIRQVTYPNLIGRIPLVHIANQAGEGEHFGHAEGEGLVTLMQRYGDVISAAIEGNILQGRPTPVITFEEQEDLQFFESEYGSVTSETLPNGDTRKLVDYDIDLSQIMTISGATFAYESGGNFSEDVAKILEILFYLFLQHAEIPEFVMGNAIASSKASAETQMPIFEKFIEGKQGETRMWLLQIAEIVLAYLSLTTPGVAAQRPDLQWRKISTDGRLTLATVEWAYASGLLDRRTALMLAPVEVADIDEVLDLAKEEYDARLKQQAEQEVMTFAGRQNRNSKAKTNPLSDDAENKDNEDARLELYAPQNQASLRDFAGNMEKGMHSNGYG